MADLIPWIDQDFEDVSTNSGITMSNSSGTSNLSNTSTYGQIWLLLQVFVLLGAYRLLQTIKTPRNTSILTSQMYIKELLDGNDERFLDMMRIWKPLFEILCNQIAKTSLFSCILLATHQAIEQLRIDFSTAAKQFLCMFLLPCTAKKTCSTACS
ncbi:uncharacterized protein VP01_11426g1 [Puccinia sorghi]|uniref:DUF8040 domain-containing protein n=1 Tax=Puccinia sorghi TaxID=27349 RepID=A0A0L6VRW4_9BASI|nr:uncharacterized protein VP01_11426g1 [Puccinia sorghi]